MSRLMRYYFETSALNEFASSHTVQDAIATKALQNFKGRGWYLSPVVLWEILLTANEIQRESLIQFAQHLFEPVLLPSPEELIVRYVASGCPKVETEYPLASSGLFAKTWRDICSIKEKTIIYDPALISKKTAVLRNIGRLFHEFTKFNSIDISAKPDIAGAQVSIQQLLDRHSIIPKEYREDFESIRHIRLVTFFILLILCAGATIDGEVIDNFWKLRGARTMQDRIDIVFTQFPELIFTGPFNQFAYMAHFQSEQKFTRGVYFDCLHTIYSIYADKFLTFDEHFRVFRENLKETYPYVFKIHHLDELEFSSVSVSNPPTESFLLRRS
jgi:hypothetical protein